jgi:copper(I)-binding protein
MTGPAEGFPHHSPRRRAGPGRRRTGTAILILAAAAALGGCGSPQQVIQSGTIGANAQVGHVLLRNVYVQRSTATSFPNPGDATVRLVLINQASRPDTLTGVSTDVAGRVEILSDADCDGRAQVVPRLDLPARVDSTSPPNAPGPTAAGYFLHLVDLKVGIIQGGSVPITFTFSRAGTVTLPTPVEGPAPPPAAVATGTGCATT